MSSLPPSPPPSLRVSPPPNLPRPLAKRHHSNNSWSSGGGGGLAARVGSGVSGASRTSRASRNSRGSGLWTPGGARCDSAVSEESWEDAKDASMGEVPAGQRNILQDTRGGRHENLHSDGSHKDDLEDDHTEATLVRTGREFTRFEDKESTSCVSFAGWRQRRDGGCGGIGEDVPGVAGWKQGACQSKGMGDAWNGDEAECLSLGAMPLAMRRGGGGAGRPACAENPAKPAVERWEDKDWERGFFGGGGRVRSVRKLLGKTLRRR